MREPRFWRIRREKAYEDKVATNRKNDKATEQAYVEKIIGSVESVVQTLNRQDNETNSNTQWERKWRKREVVGIWAAALVGLIAIIWSAYDSSKQRDLMQGQINEMQAEARPMLSVDVSVGRVIWDGAGAHVVISYRVKNSGRMAALHTTLDTALLTWIPAGTTPTTIQWMDGVSHAPPKTDSLDGFTVLAGESQSVIEEKLLTRANVESFRRLLQTAKHDVSDPDRPPISDADLNLPMTVGYSVSYGFGNPEVAHKTYCWVRFGKKIPTDNPLSIVPILTVPFNVNLGSADIVVSEGDAFCGSA